MRRNQLRTFVLEARHHRRSGIERLTPPLEFSRIGNAGQPLTRPRCFQNRSQGLSRTPGGFGGSQSLPRGFSLGLGSGQSGLGCRFKPLGLFQGRLRLFRDRFSLRQMCFELTI
ncbi:hypothetical protein D3C71_1566350 [compost metagenome]